MTAANEQIISAFEELDMSPEQIAEDQDLDLTAVKSTLMQFSSKYRQICKKNPESEFNFSDDEAIRARQVIAQLAQYAEDESLKLRAAMFVLNDKKGRLDAPKALTGLNINVIQMNEHFKKAIEAVNKVKELSNSQVVVEA